MVQSTKTDNTRTLGPSFSTDISKSDYAALTRRLIGLIKDLRALGYVGRSILKGHVSKARDDSAEADFSLPRIAVIGKPLFSR